MNKENHNFAAIFHRYNIPMNNNNQLWLCDMLIMSQICINTITDQETIAFLDELRNTPYYRNKVKMIEKQIRADIATRDKMISASIKRSVDLHCSKTERSVEEMYDAMCDVLDSSDIVINKSINGMKEYIDSKIPLFGNCAPREPLLVRQMIVSEILTIVCESVFRNNKRVSSYMERYNAYDHMNMEGTSRRVVTLCGMLAGCIKNKFGGSLDMNWSSIYESKELFGEKNERGVYVGGYVTEIRKTLFSTNFMDRIYLARDGNDLHLRDRNPSILEGLDGCFDIDILSQ